MVYARQFGRKRNVDNGQTPCRLYAIESSPFRQRIAGRSSLAVKSSAIPALAYQLAKALRRDGAR